MNEGKGVMTYDTFMETPSISGVPGIAVRLGRALENWGRAHSSATRSEPTNREARRREHERQQGIEARMLHDERLLLQHR